MYAWLPPPKVFVLLVLFGLPASGALRPSSKRKHSYCNNIAENYPANRHKTPFDTMETWPDGTDGYLQTF